MDGDFNGVFHRAYEESVSVQGIWISKEDNPKYRIRRTGTIGTANRVGGSD